ncbi:MAG: type II toxin-antitoxin system PemK/MazF family toxin [Gaiellaceae bacterium]
MTRGEVVRLPAPRRARGHEQRGRRYGVVVQAEQLLDLSTVIVAPTSTSSIGTRFRPEIVIRGTPTRVLIEQLRAVAPESLGQTETLVTHDELRAIDRALALVLGL